jgi:YD repeat-containing protein
VLKIVGEATKEKKYYQFIKTKGEKGNSYLLNFWVKNNGIPNYNGKNAQVIVVICNNDNTYDYTNIPINPSKEWQYISKPIVTKKEYRQIDIYLTFEHNANEIYFDNINLLKDISGTSFTYDALGNITTVENAVNQETQFKYDSKNQLTQTKAPNGTKWEYTYDANVKNRITKAENESNISYNFTYDTFGNGTKLEIKDRDNSEYIENSIEYSFNGKFATSFTDELGNTSRTTYNANTGTITNTTDPKNIQTNYTYDSLDRVIAVSKEEEGETYQNQYAYANGCIIENRTPK